VSEERRRALRRDSLRYCPVTVARDTYYVMYDFTWNHCATKQPQQLRSIFSSTMDNKNESKATWREPQPSAVSKGRARKEAGHHTCRKSELFFWNSNHEKKMQEIRRENAGKWMQISTCVVIIVGTAANAAVSIPASGPGHEGGKKSTKHRRNLVHTETSCRTRLQIVR